MRWTIILVILLSVSFVSAVNSTNYGVDTYVVSQGGGLDATSTNYNISLTLGEITGNLSSLTYNILMGFWQAVTNICGDGVCESSGENCGSCVADCACASGYTCTSNVCVATVVTPAAGAPGGGGGAGTSTGVSKPSIDFDITPWLYEKTMVEGRTDTGEMTITNNENRELNFQLRVEVLKDAVILSQTSVDIPAGESRTIGFTIQAPKTGIYTGKIAVSSGSTQKSMLFSLNVRTEKSLFDIVLTIPKIMKTIMFGKEETISVQIDLLQMGVKKQMDVTLHYVIKDFDGNTYFKESETIAVYDEKSFIKEFHIQEMPPNDYVVGAELIYPDGVAVASSQFRIQEEIKPTKGNMVVVISAILFLAVLVAVVIAIKRYKRKGMHLSKSKKKRNALK